MRRRGFAVGTMLCLLTVICLAGCKAESDHPETVQPDSIQEESLSETEEISEEQEGASQEAESGIDQEFVEDMILVYEEILAPMGTAEDIAKLDTVAWDEKIKPYMEYNWLEDSGIEANHLADNRWVIQIGDLNLDGQPEMLISEVIYNKEEYTYVYTVKDGEVAPCGAINGSRDYMFREDFPGTNLFYPAYYVDVYQNEEGDLRFLSCDVVQMASWGWFQIYVSTFDGENISSEPVYGAGYAESSDGEIHYTCYVGNVTEDNEQIEDDVKYSEFNRLMSEYMQGYEMVDMAFVASDYYPPEVAMYMPEEYKDTVSDNIRLSFAKAYGYDVVTETEEDILTDEELSQINEKAKLAYEEYVSNDENMRYYATPTGEEKMKYRTEYTVADADGNGIVDLVIREPRQWYFFAYDYEKDEMVNFAAIGSGHSFEYDMLQDGTYIYWGIEGPQYEDGHYKLYFRHFYLDEEGEDVDIERFWIEDINDNLEYGKGDDITIRYADGENAECSYEEWRATAWKYIEMVGGQSTVDKDLKLKDTVEWTVYFEG
ncbi:MAG: hypothetical protein IJ336_01260 [Lachnospiraceae bacterium]|nr:hypothetical protein [Lachnospiraceae bacterium]